MGFSNSNDTNKPDALPVKTDAPHSDLGFGASAYHAFMSDVSGAGTMLSSATGVKTDNTGVTGLQLNQTKIDYSKMGTSNLGGMFANFAGDVAGSVTLIAKNPGIVVNGLINAGNTIVDGSAADRGRLFGHGLFFGATLMAGGEAAAARTSVTGDLAATKSMIGSVDQAAAAANMLPTAMRVDGLAADAVNAARGVMAGDVLETASIADRTTPTISSLANDARGLKVIPGEGSILPKIPQGLGTDATVITSKAGTLPIGETGNLSRQVVLGGAKTDAGLSTRVVELANGGRTGVQTIGETGLATPVFARAGTLGQDALGQLTHLPGESVGTIETTTVGGARTAAVAQEAVVTPGLQIFKEGSLLTDGKGLTGTVLQDGGAARVPITILKEGQSLTGETSTFARDLTAARTDMSQVAQTLSHDLRQLSATGEEQAALTRFTRAAEDLSKGGDAPAALKEMNQALNTMSPALREQVLNLTKPLEGSVARASELTYATETARGVQIAAQDTSNALTKLVPAEGQSALSGVQKVLADSATTDSATTLRMLRDEMSRLPESTQAAIRPALQEFESSLVKADQASYLVQQSRAVETVAQSASTKLEQLASTAEERSALSGIQKTLDTAGTADRSTTLSTLREQMSTLQDTQPELYTKVSQQLQQVEATLVKADQATFAVEQTRNVETVAQDVSAKLAQAAPGQEQALAGVQKVLREASTTDSATTVRNLDQQMAALRQADPALFEKLSPQLQQFETAAVKADQATFAVEQTRNVEAVAQDVSAKLAQTAPGQEQALAGVQKVLSEAGTTDSAATVRNLDQQMANLRQADPALFEKVSPQLQQFESAAVKADQATFAVEQMRNVEALAQDTSLKLAQTAGQEPALAGVQKVLSEAGTTDSATTLRNLQNEMTNLQRSDAALFDKVSPELKQFEATVAKADQATFAVEQTRNVEALAQDTSVKLAQTAGQEPALAGVQKVLSEAGTTDSATTLRNLQNEMTNLQRSDAALFDKVSPELKQFEATVAKADQATFAVEQARNVEALAQDTSVKLAQTAGQEPALAGVQKVLSEAGTTDSATTLRNLQNEMTNLQRSDAALFDKVSPELKQFEATVAKADQATFAVEQARNVEALAQDTSVKLAQTAGQEPALAGVQKVLSEAGTTDSATTLRNLQNEMTNLQRSDAALFDKVSPELKQFEATVAKADQATFAVEQTRNVEALAQDTSVKLAQTAGQEPALAGVQKVLSEAGTTDSATTLRNLQNEMTNLQRSDAALFDKVSPELKQFEATVAKADQATFAVEQTRNVESVLQDARLSRTVLPESVQQEVQAINATRTQFAENLSNISATTDREATAVRKLTQATQDIVPGAENTAKFTEMRATIKDLPPSSQASAERLLTQMETQFTSAQKFEPMVSAIQDTSQATQALATQTKLVSTTAPVADAPALREFSANLAKVSATTDSSAYIAGLNRSLGEMSVGTQEQLAPMVTRLEAAMTRSTSETFSLYGDRVQQGVEMLKAATPDPAIVAQLRQDIGAMKALAPEGTQTAKQLSAMDQSLSAVEASHNALTLRTDPLWKNLFMGNPAIDVSAMPWYQKPLGVIQDAFSRITGRADTNRLVEIAQGSDQATATAAVDRLILSGKAGSITDGPALGLVSERQAFWQAQDALQKARIAEQASWYKPAFVLDLANNASVTMRSLFTQQMMKDMGFMFLSGAPATYGVYRGLLDTGSYVQSELNRRAATVQADHTAASTQKQGDGAAKATDGSTTSASAANPNANAAINAGSQNSNTVSGAARVTAEQLVASGGGGGPSSAEALQRAAEYQRVAAYQGDGAVSQAVFSRQTDDHLKPVIQVMGFPTNGKNWWLQQQYGGQPWLWARYSAPVVASASDAQVVSQAQRPRFASFQPGGDDPRRNTNPGLLPPKWISVRSASEMIAETRGLTRESPFVSAVNPMIGPARSWQNTWLQPQQVRTAGGRGDMKGHELHNMMRVEETDEAVLDSANSAATAGGVVKINPVTGAAIVDPHSVTAGAAGTPGMPDPNTGLNQAIVAQNAGQPVAKQDEEEVRT